MNDLIIFGASGHARVVADVVKNNPQWRLAGFVDHALSTGMEFAGSHVLGPDGDLPRIIGETGVRTGVIAVGDNALRRKIREKIALLCPDFSFATVVHPSSCIAEDVEIGAGTVVMAGAVVNPGTRIGQFCIVNTRSSLDHDCSMGDYASLAPGCTVGGTVSIGHCAAICIGAVLKHGVTVGDHALVGAGSVILKDVPGRSVWYGVPGKFIRQRKEGAKYL